MSVFVLGEAQVDLEQRQIRRGQQTIGLTSAEVELLRYLDARPGEVIERATLEREVLGLHPDSRSRALHHAMTRLRRKLEPDPSAPRFLITVRGAGYRLERRAGPRPGSRSQELAQLARMLHAHRWVTITGPGGIGKTWLAQAWLQQQQGTFCELSGARSARQLALGVAEALQIPPELLSTDAPRAITRALVFRGPTLLVLDNLEQCEGAAALLARWVQDSDDLTLLCTSRIALGDAPCLQLGPVPVDEATALFVQAARRVRPDFQAPERRLAPIVDRLDGVPLALQLAAATLDVLDLDQLERTLSSPSRALPALSGTLASSWALCSEAARRVLVAACVLEAPCTADALSTIACVPPVEVLRDLVRASMLDAIEGPRFWLRPLVRDFVRAQVDDPILQRARTAAADWYLERLEGWIEADLTRGEVEQLAAERWSLLALAASIPAPPTQARLLIGAYHAVERHGPLQTWLGAVEALDVGALDGPLAAQLAWRHANSARLIGDTHHAIALARRGLERSPDPGDEARLQLTVALCQLDLGDLDGAIETYARVLSHAPAVLRPRVRYHLAVCHYRRWELQEAARHAQAAQDRFRAQGNLRFTAAALNISGLIRWRQGDLSTAEACFSEAVELHEASGSRLMWAAALDNLGLMAHEAGRLDEALAHYQRALSIHRHHGAIRGMVISLGNLGELYREQGALDQAHEVLIESLALAEDHGDARLIASALGSLGDVADQRGDPQGARLYWRRGLEHLDEGQHDDIHRALSERLERSRGGGPTAP